MERDEKVSNGVSFSGTTIAVAPNAKVLYRVSLHTASHLTLASACTSSSLRAQQPCRLRLVMALQPEASAVAACPSKELPPESDSVCSEEQAASACQSLAEDSQLHPVMSSEMSWGQARANPQTPLSPEAASAGAIGRPARERTWFRVHGVRLCRQCNDPPGPGK